MSPDDKDVGASSCVRTSVINNGNWNENAKQILRPVTVRQMLEARKDHSGANLAIDGNEVVQVTTVANVVLVDKSHATRHDFHLEDGTRGRITGRKWHDTRASAGIPEEEADINGIVASIYVRVIGELEQYNGRNYLNITNIRKIVDYHEFCFHILDAMIITLTYERGPPPRDISQNQSAIAGEAGHTRIEQPSASQAEQLDVFDTTFAMHAMRDSLSASPASAAAPALSSSPFLQSFGDMVTQPPEMLSDSDISHDINDSPNLFSSVPPRKDKGKGRADPIINKPGLRQTSSSLEFTPKGNSQPRSPIQGYSTQSPQKPTTSFTSSAPDGVRDLSTTRKTYSRPLSFPSPSFPDNSSIFTERKLDPYVDIGLLGRRIMLLLFEMEHSSPIYPMAEVDAKYQGVHVATILTRMHAQDNTITPNDIDVEISFLITEGYIYTTIDECHVKIAQTH